MHKGLKADLFLVVLVAFWGMSFYFMKGVLLEMSVVAFLSTRFVLASMILGLLYGRKLLTMDKETCMAGLYLGLSLAAGMFLQVTGLIWTSASNSGFITTFYVIFVPLMLAIYFRKLPEGKMMVASLLAFLGMLAIGGGSLTGLNIGDFLTLLSAVFFAIQVILTNIYGKRYDPIQVGVLQILVVGGLATLAWSCTGFSNFNPGLWSSTAIVVTAVFCTAIPFVGIMVLQKHTTAERTAIISTLESVFALLFVVLLPSIDGSRETLSLHAMIGFICVFLALVVAESNFSKKNEMRLQKTTQPIVNNHCSVKGGETKHERPAQ